MLADLTGRIYHAALGEEDWSAVLGRLADLFAAEAAVLSPAGFPLTAEATVRIRCDPAYVSLYNAHYHRISPINTASPQRRHGSVLVDFMLVPESDFIRTELYNDYMRPQGRHTGLGWVDIDGCGHPAHLTFWRSRRHPRWDEEQVALLRYLGGHIRRALRLERRLAAVAHPGPDPGTRRLSARQRDCLAWIARGDSSKQVARRLDLSVHTVEGHVNAAIRRLGAANRTEAVMIAMARGLLGP
jgi:DNA-binding CsgD family transcriptional regulator